MTTNVSLAWTKVADTSVLSFSMRWNENVPLLFATSATSAAPTGFAGTLFEPNDVVTRESVGLGHVWARLGNSIAVGVVAVQVTVGGDGLSSQQLETLSALQVTNVGTVEAPGYVLPVRSVPLSSTENALLTSTPGYTGELALASDTAAVVRLNGVAGGGRIAGRFQPYLWANRPSAASNVGTTIRITDVGTGAGGSLWVSDGTYWRPQNGHVLLHSAFANDTSSPLIARAGNGAFRYLTGAPTLLIPGGMNIPGARLNTMYMSRKTGTEIGGFYVMLGSVNQSASGTTNGVLISDFTATNPQPNYGTATAIIRSGGFWGTYYAGMGGGPQRVDDYQLANNTDANINTEARYLSFAIGDTFTAATSVALLGVQVTLEM